MNDYDREAVLEEVSNIWKEVYEKGSDTAIEAEHNSDLRLN